MGTVQELPIIAGVELTMDEHGRYNLSALHKAYLVGSPSTSRKNKQPADWLKLESTKELIDEVSNSEYLHSYSGSNSFDPRSYDDSNSEDPRNKVIESKPGRYGGTFAHELLAVSYAGWISPKFQIQVNQAFIDYKSGKASKPMTTLEWLEHSLEAEKARLRLEEKREKLEATVIEMKPKAVFHDQVVTSEGSISVEAAAKLLGTGRNKLFAFMRKVGWVKRDNVAYQKYINNGYLDLKYSPWNHPKTDEVVEGYTTVITGAGLSALQKIYGKEDKEAEDL